MSMHPAEETFPTAEALLDALARRNERWGSWQYGTPDQWLFRGQADASWDLIPSALRESVRYAYGINEHFRPMPLHSDQLSMECEVVSEFLHVLNQEGLAAPNEASHRWREFFGKLGDLIGAREWPPSDLGPLFALAQHHGIPTRLLDWTDNPLVAAYFAAIDSAAGGSEREFLAVWALDYLEAERFINGAVNSIELLTPGLKIRRIDPPKATNTNLRAQGGVFTVLTDATREPTGVSSFPPLNRLIASKDTSGRYEFSPCIRKLQLPVKQAGRLLRLLAMESVTAARLFPGLAGVERSLRERAYWRR